MRGIRVTFCGFVGENTEVVTCPVDSDAIISVIFLELGKCKR